MSIKRKIREIIRDNPTPYRIYIKLALGRKLRLPGSQTDCHLTGFPRSANTFTRYIVNHVYRELSFVTHIHTIASLKLALRYKVPIAIIIRDPIDCTISMCMKYSIKPTDAKGISGVLDDYTHYHTFLEQRVRDFAVFKFEDVTESPVQFARQIGEFLEVEKISENLDYEVQEVMSQFADREKLKDPLGSSLPQKARQDRKDAYHNAVNQSPDLAAALAIYERFRLRSL